MIGKFLTKAQGLRDGMSDKITKAVYISIDNSKYFDNYIAVKSDTKKEQMIYVYYNNTCIFNNTYQVLRNILYKANFKKGAIQKFSKGKILVKTIGSHDYESIKEAKSVKVCFNQQNDYHGSIEVKGYRCNEEKEVTVTIEDQAGVHFFGDFLTLCQILINASKR